MARPLGKTSLYLDGTDLPPRELIGGKAWSVARMMSLGLNVPPAFVITTNACRDYLAQGTLPDSVRDELRTGIAALQDATGRTFGTGPSPLLVSVRSGAPVSMPGMMDTVLNLGIDDAGEAALAMESADPAFARDTHRRFYEMYARIVMKATLAPLAPDAEPADWRSAIAAAGAGELPETPWTQLEAAVGAVFGSWNGRRAKRYRKHHGIADDTGTAVTVQAMVFGNLGTDSGTGVLFSRNPLSGDPTPFGEYLASAQGEDVVSGEVTPDELDAMHRAMPALHDELLAAASTLEAENGDVQDIEFTVQHGTLYLLQSRAAKRAPEAAVRIATDMVRDGQIDTAEALRRVNAEQVRSLLRPHLVNGTAEHNSVIAQGEGACPGVGAGRVVTDADAAEAAAAEGHDVVLVRPTTSPDDVHGMVVARAIVTAHGGATSHAAVVSRALGLPCIVGCGDDAVAALADQDVTVDGQAGTVFAGRLPVEAPDENDNPLLQQLTAWASDAAPLAVRDLNAAANEGATDLDHVPGGELPEELPRILAGLKSARGGALNSDEGVAAAVAAGLEFIGVSQKLPALLAACAAARGESQE